jgi:hypothetical protein
MSNSEYADRHERKYQKPYEELREESNARHIHNALRGQLAPTKSEWIEKWRKEK